MHTENVFCYTEDEEMQLLAMPYVNKQLKMVFILPQERFGLAELEKSLTGQKFWQWVDKSHESTAYVSMFDIILIAGFQKYILQVTLPKFKMETSLSLVENLKRLGISDRFSNRADFSKITTAGQLCVSNVMHKAFLEVKFN